MQAEATKISPARQKFDFDHAKLLIETKDNVNTSIDSTLNKGFSCIQFCGVELFKYRLSHVADTLYVNNSVVIAAIPPAAKNFDFIKHLCIALLDTNSEWLNLQRSIIIANNTPKSAYPSHASQHSDSPAFKKSPSWYPPRPDQKTASLNPIPPNLE